MWSGGLPNNIFKAKIPSLPHFWCLKTNDLSLYTCAKHCAPHCFSDIFSPGMKQQLLAYFPSFPSPTPTYLWMITARTHGLSCRFAAVISIFPNPTYPTELSLSFITHVQLTAVRSVEIFPTCDRSVQQPLLLLLSLQSCGFKILHLFIFGASNVVSS